MNLQQTKKWAQIPAALTYIMDNQNKYTKNKLFDIYEFGVYKGNSLRKIHDIVIKNSIPYRYIIGIDSFNGLPQENIKAQLFPKFKKGSYNIREFLSIEKIKFTLLKNTVIINEEFINLNKNHIEIYNLQKAQLIHIDCDLYISTLQALNFMFSNELIDKHTLIAYDEFWSVTPPKSGGECKAHNEVMERFNVKAEEIWHNIYYDKDNGQKFRQAVFEIL